MAKLPPLLIESVKMGSEQDKWTTINIKPGERLASYKVKYLFPEISYYGLRLETVNLIYKIYDSSGNIHCTCETEVSLSKGSSSHQLTAYGSNSGGSWKAGTYRIDIWYKSTLLYSKNFTIESS